MKIPLAEKVVKLAKLIAKELTRSRVIVCDYSTLLYSTLLDSKVGRLAKTKYYLAAGWDIFHLITLSVFNMKARLKSVDSKFDSLMSHPILPYYLL